MKRNLISVLLAVILCMTLAIGVSAAGSEEYLVFDEAGLLTEAEQLALTDRLLEISHQYDAQILVCTVDSLSGTDIDDYLEYVYDEMEFGYGEQRDGVLLLICMETREYRILSNGFAGEAIDSGDISKIGSAIESDLSDGWYSDAFETYAEKCEYYLEGYVNGYPFNAGKNLLIAIVIGLIAGVTVAMILKGQLKSVRKQEQANVYVKKDSMEITARKDIFLYRDLQRTRKESSKSSGSGSSRSTGGGSF